MADAIYKDVRIDGHVISEAVIIVCGVDETWKRDILSVDPMADESYDAYKCVFGSLKDRGLITPRLIIRDANNGFVTAIKQSFFGAGWQCCKVHFKRNILAHIPAKAIRNIRF